MRDRRGTGQLKLNIAVSRESETVKETPNQSQRVNHIVVNYKRQNKNKRATTKKKRSKSIKRLKQKAQAALVPES